MKVLDADWGSCAKAEAACCAATKALCVLTFVSRVRSAKVRVSGSLLSLGVAAAASPSFSMSKSCIVKRRRTVVDNNTRETEKFLDLGEDTCNGTWIGQVTHNVDYLCGVVALVGFSADGGYFVSAFGESLCDALPYVGTGAEQEQDLG